MDSSQNIISSDSSGTMTDALYQREARPYSWAGADEKLIYDSNTMVKHFSDGTMKRVWKITKRENINFKKEKNDEYDLPLVDNDIATIISENNIGQTNGREMISVNFKLRNVPQYNIPLNPPDGLLNSQERSLSVSRKQAAYDTRESRILTLSTNVIADIESYGGTIEDINILTGWVTAQVPVDYLSTLSARLDIKKIYTANHENVENTCDTTCTENEYSTQSQYHHQCILGESRRSDFIDADRFINAGHNADGLIASDTQLGELWDEMCYLNKVGNCIVNNNTTRLKYKYVSCSQTGVCTPISNFSETNCGADSHGILVTSILTSDFKQGQAMHHEYEDPCWDPSGYGHCSNWQNNSTGIAPMANLAFFGLATSQENLAGSILASTNSNYSIDADVINITLSQGSNQCDPYDSPVDSDAIETAYDAGAFVVVASGNGDSPSSTTCHVQNPGDTPKAFTVASVETNNPIYEPPNGNNNSCLSGNYDDCMQRYYSSLRGGAEAKTAVGNFSGELSVIDLVAPGCVSYRSSCDATGVLGRIFTGSTCGSSVATPIVSGSALLVKDWLISEGITEIYNPGVLYAVMLGMGDRFSEATGGQGEIGGDPWSGFGRLKLRYLNDNTFGPGWYSIDRHTFQGSSSTHEYFPFDVPVPATANILKCVSHNSEDVSSWSKLAYTTLELIAYDPKVTYGPPPYYFPQYYCEAGTNPSGASQIDNSHDTKHLVAFDSTTTSVNISQFRGKCLRVKIVGITPYTQYWFGRRIYKSVTANTFCYLASVSDNQ